MCSSDLSALETIGDNYEKVVVSLDDMTLPLKGGIKHIRAWEMGSIL